MGDGRIYIFGGLGLLFVLYLLYARVIAAKNKAQEAASTIQVQLQMRRDLLPNMFTLAQKFMDHEKDLLTEITSLRAEAAKVSTATDAGALTKGMALDEAIGGALGRFFATVENYPDLKSQEPILRAQATCDDAEGNIAAARRFYNAEVASLNTLCETWPMSWLAVLAGVKSLPYFSAGAHAEDAVLASDYMS